MAKTAPRQPIDEDVQRELLRSMVQMLMEFSSRIALDALDRWPRTENGRWFPTFHELHQLCLALQAERRRAHAAPSKAAPTYTATPEERAEMVQLLYALSLAQQAHNGAKPDLSRLTAAGRAEYARVLGLFRADRAALEATARARGFRTVRELMANRRLTV